VRVVPEAGQRHGLGHERPELLVGVQRIQLAAGKRDGTSRRREEPAHVGSSDAEGGVVEREPVAARDLPHACDGRRVVGVDETFETGDAKVAGERLLPSLEHLRLLCCKRGRAAEVVLAPRHLDAEADDGRRLCSEPAAGETQTDHSTEGVAEDDEVLVGAERVYDRAGQRVERVPLQRRRPSVAREVGSYDPARPTIGRRLEHPGPDVAGRAEPMEQQELGPRDAYFPSVERAQGGIHSRRGTAVLDSARMPEDRSVAIALEGVGKRFGKVGAVCDVTLAIREGEFFSLLGPSGCGKTTTLRMIAGFEVPDEGRILLQGHEVTSVPPNRRPVNMVFQHYALFPHMSIYDNLAFGLKVKRVPRDEHGARIREMLRVVELEGLERRRIRQLSGGQQQRVALARALVNRPAALLLDEPLGALDVKLRKQMQLELKRIQTELGTTFVYVTHDQEEALAMSDRIAVMNGGRVEQVAGPREIYEHPQTAFVADFIGSLNALELTVDEVVGGYALMRLGENERVVVGVDSGARIGDSLRIAVRPERVQIRPLDGSSPEGGSRLEGTIAEIVYLGMYTQFHVDTSAGRVTCHRLADELLGPLAPGAAVELSWDADHTSILGAPAATAEPAPV
jgi:spermidine/putrescine transport system ATP-binding protein